jgi:hypothetical protein
MNGVKFVVLDGNLSHWLGVHGEMSCFPTLFFSQKAFVFFGVCVVFLGVRLHCYCNTQSKNGQLPYSLLLMYNVGTIASGFTF